MKELNIAILGAGTVGGGVAKILLDQNDVLAERAGMRLHVKKIVDLFPGAASQRHQIPAEYFCGNKKEISKEEASSFIEEILQDDSIDLIVETIGGSGEYIKNLAERILKAKKHLVTANKALLALYGNQLTAAARENKVILGYEAAVCGAIPIIKGISECYTGDVILSVSGIFNGTSNYILSRMDKEGLSFAEALKGAQEKGYAEADPSLDINGGDAGHKLTLLLRLVYGIDVEFKDLFVKGVENINQEELDFAREIDCTIKLICFAKKEGKNVYAFVQPMLVKNDNILFNINGATNGVKLTGQYSQENVMIGEGAGSLETGSAIVSDIVFIAKYGESAMQQRPSEDLQLKSYEQTSLAYNIIFETEDIPGITGIITTAIGNEKININTVSHNRHNKEKAEFSIATMPCTLMQIKKAIASIPEGVLIREPDILPILS